MSSKSTASKTSREQKLEQIRQQNAADARRQRAIIIGAVIVVLVLVGVTATAITLAVRDEATASASDPEGLTLTNADDPDSGGFTLGTEGGAVQVALYEDFQCPACAQYEAVNAEFFTGLEENPDVDLVFRPIAILDRADIYSTRSAGASACVAETGDDEVFEAFRISLFVNQPTEGAVGLPTERLAQLAVEAGAGEAVEQCILDETYNGWAGRTTASARDAGIAATPSVTVNGELLQSPQGGPPSPEEIEAAIDAAAG